MNIRPGFRKLFIGVSLVTLAVFAWDSLNPPGTASPVAAVAPAASRAALTSVSEAAVAAALPTTLGHPVLDVAAVNPFEGSSGAGLPGVASLPPPLPLPPSVATPSLPPPIPPSLAAIAAPVAPTVVYRYVGQMRDPGGRLIVYIGTGTSESVALQGSELEGGWKVAEVTDKSIRLVHTASDTTATLDIPVQKE